MSSFIGIKLRSDKAFQVENDSEIIKINSLGLHPPIPRPGYTPGIEVSETEFFH